MEIDKKIIESYMRALKENIYVKKYPGRIVFSLPFYISGGHFIEITAKTKGEEYISFSDKTRTIGDLFLSGLSISGKNKKIIDEIVKRHRLNLNDNLEITAIAKIQDAGKILHQIILALISIGNLEILGKLKIFQPEKIVRKVKQIAEKVEVPVKYGPAAVVPGFEVERLNFDLVIENGGLRVVKTIDRKGGFEDYIEACAFKFEDVIKANKNVKRTVIYNPENEKWDAFKHIITNRLTNESDAVISIEEENKIAEVITR